MQALIYRLVTSVDWEKAQGLGHVPRSEADKRSGFVHLSVEDQVLESANRYFNVEQSPIVLEIDSSNLGDDLKWETVQSRNNISFPHLYAKPIPLYAIRGVIQLNSPPGGGFEWGDRHSGHSWQKQ